MAFLRFGVSPSASRTAHPQEAWGRGLDCGCARSAAASTHATYYCYYDDDDDYCHFYYKFRTSATGSTRLTVPEQY